MNLLKRNWWRDTAKQTTPKPRISGKITCLIGSRQTSETYWSWVWVACRCWRETGAGPSLKGHTCELVKEGSAETVTCDASWTKGYTLLGIPYYSPVIPALAWCSSFYLGGPMAHHSTSFISRRLSKSQALGALLCPAILHKLINTGHV